MFAPAVFAADALPRGALFGPSETGVSAVGWTNSVRVPLEDAAGSCAMTLAAGGSGHAGVAAGVFAADACPLVRDGGFGAGAAGDVGLACGGPLSTLC